MFRRFYAQEKEVVDNVTGLSYMHKTGDLTLYTVEVWKGKEYESGENFGNIRVVKLSSGLTVSSDSNVSRGLTVINFRGRVRAIIYPSSVGYVCDITKRKKK